MNGISRKWFIMASLSGAAAVGLGAFGAHGLKGVLTDYGLAIWEKAVLYQFVHTIGIAIVGVVLTIEGWEKIRWAGWFWMVGIVLFSGSLYLLALKDHFQWIKTGVLGPITPLGGLCFIAGWLMFFVAAVSGKKSK
ncbi:MAG: DUF423 domain-containing protein [Bacteroidia bacterium]|nr:DUF423 domain-containing protein [Bacteroidia bacterium]